MGGFYLVFKIIPFRSDLVSGIARSWMIRPEAPQDLPRSRPSRRGRAGMQGAASVLKAPTGRKIRGLFTRSRAPTFARALTSPPISAASEPAPEKAMLGHWAAISSARRSNR
jgi:hypothetical protein